MGKYSREPAEPTKSAKARVDDLRASFKNTYETAITLKGMKLKKALKYLDQVLEHKQAIPFRRYCCGIGRTAQAKPFKHTQGRWPEKSVTQMIMLLHNAQANAESKGLDVDKCVISHVQVNKAVQGRRRTYRAHGRMTPYLSSNCHVELFLSEKEENVKKGPEDKKAVRLTKKQAAKQRLAIGGGSA